MKLFYVFLGWINTKLTKSTRTPLESCLFVESLFRVLNSSEIPLNLGLMQGLGLGLGLGQDQDRDRVRVRIGLKSQG
jgi:hypothetical protein